ncbi:MAG: hypothetical protein MMC33_008862 [Icmadophila ericetorum]|nr:hypothetical protein [Icmadophila ericetorum]
MRWQRAGHKLTANSSNLLPRDLIEETERTLGLLLPSGEKDFKQWFNKKQEELGLDANAGRCRQQNNSARQVEKFQYWRDRLVILKQTFDEKEPQTISQRWYDDRKKVQWYTFWVAVCWS